MLRRWFGLIAFVSIPAMAAAGCSATNDEVDGTTGGPTSPSGCTATQTLCGDNCVDTEVSNLHCGACGRGCQDGETCLAGECTSMNECGDGEVDGDEQCDDGGQATANCDIDCTVPVCGDDVVNSNAGEECDGGGGETATCDADCTVVECGDGIVNAAAGEVCENDMVESATCDSDCTAAECGDGVVNMAAGETCDDGAESMTCDADCTAAECGDGVINATAMEECDDMGESPTCDDDCTAPACGDGVLNVAAGEECDDGNNAPDDGCSGGCLDEVPPVCTTGMAGVQSGSNWVVCEADATGAWLSHGVTDTGGIYDPLVACQSLGYNSVGQYGGNCGDVCSYCTNSGSCMNPGTKSFANTGGKTCGAQFLCYTVMWECLP